jgi:hypothetical protein
MKPWILTVVTPALLLGEIVYIDNNTARLGIETMGAGIVDFQLKGHGLNPFTWVDLNRPIQLRGHFICLDRWGAPSEAERANGVPFHGEAPRIAWKVTRKAAAELEMETELPLARLAVKRHVRLVGESAVVTETVKNLNPMGRVYNLVQHPSISPPFLDETTVVDANARQGFAQSSPMPNPEQPSFVWPQALLDGQPVNVRLLKDNPNPNVVSYVMDQALGWTTAVNAGKGLLLGYVWRTSEYPWFNVWRHVENGKPAARGLEFGTTGLHQPYPVLVRKGRIFGRPLVAFLDAGQSETRTYQMFLMRVEAGHTGVATMDNSSAKFVFSGRAGGQLTVEDHLNSAR